MKTAEQIKEKYTLQIQPKIEALLAFSRDQKTVNAISQDLAGSAIHNQEKLVTHSKMIFKETKESSIYDLSQKWHLRPQNSKMKFYLGIEFKNKLVLQITLSLLLESAFVSFNSESAVG